MKQSQRKKRRQKSFHFTVTLKTEKQTRSLESSDSDIKRVVANAVPESTKESTKYAVNVFEGEPGSYEQT